MKQCGLLLLGILFAGCFHSRDKTNGVTESSDLRELNFYANYTLANATTGTMTMVSLEDGYRVMRTNALPNHPTGAFPNPGNPSAIAEQKLRYKFPLQPKFSGESRWAKEPGVALNGVKFDPETAERFVCETGEVYRIEAIQELYDLGLDDNNAHVQPTGAYHYHGVPYGLIELLPGTEDIVLVGFANDGFPMYYSRSGKYKPSFRLTDDSRTGDACNYRSPHINELKQLAGSTADGTFVSDWVYDPSLGQLDECNGITLEGQYAYFVTDEYPYVGRCLKGEFTQQGPQVGGPPPGRHGHPHQH